MRVGLTALVVVALLAPGLWAGEIHDVAQQGDTLRLAALLAADSSLLDIVDDSGDTPLLYAAYAGQVAATRMLLAHGAQVDATRRNGSTPLHGAAYAGFVDVVRLLLDAGAPVNAVNRGQSTPLHSACNAGRAEVAQLLLERGADTRLFNGNGGTPLHVAAASGSTATIKTLLDHGCELEATTADNGGTPLFWAAWNGRAEAVDALVAAGANIHCAVQDGWTALHSAAMQDRTEVISRLVAAGADPTASSGGSGSPLAVACGYGKVNALRTILSLKPGAVRTVDSDSSTLLHHAARSGQLPTTQLLLEQGLDPNAKNAVGTTPLVWAIYSGSAEVVDFLISAGADAKATDNRGYTALSAATGSGNSAIVARLLTAGADVTQREANGATLLFTPVMRGSDSVVALLIDRGADIKAAEQRTGRTVLHLAAALGNAYVADLLLKRGATVDVKDSLGHTPLYYAGHYGHEDVARLLTDHGAGALTSEVNFGMPAELATAPAEGEAVVWYLGHCAFAIKTANHFLIFDYYRYGKDPTRPSLTNGHVNVQELAGQKVDVFVTHEHGDHFDTTIFGWAPAVDTLTYIFGFRPEQQPQYARTGYNGPAYEFIGPREQREIDGMKVSTIAANDAGVGFLIEVDGLTLYHAGDHAGWAEGRRDGYMSEIDYLAGLTSNVDMAFLNVTGCHSHDTLALAEGTWYTLDKLRPKAWFPTHGGSNESVYAQFAQKAAGKVCGGNILVPECRGDHFIYRRTE